MVNSRYLKELEKEFKELIEEQNSVNFDVDCVTDAKSKSKTDLTKLVDCSRDYYEDLIKIYVDNERVAVLRNDDVLNIKGSSLLYIVVEEDISLGLNFEGDNFSACFLKILVRKGKKVNLVEFSKNRNLWKNLIVVLEEGADLILGQAVFESRFNVTRVYLEKEANYVLKSAYFGDEVDFYINNSAVHIGEKSRSDLKISGAVINGAKVVSDGVVKIEQNAPKSEGYQRLNGLLLDEKSSIKSEPILEIENNNVKCSHGCSISQIKDEILFYIQSRGLSEREAVELVVGGFFGDVLQSIANEEMREIYKEKVELFK